MNLMAEDRNKPHSASFSSLQTNEKFQHFRSVSYFEAVNNASNAKIRNTAEKPRAARMTSNSTPCTPKKIEIEKYSTLPIGNGISFPSKKTRSSSLSSFFRKFKPKFHRSSSDSKNPWIVIEFAPHNGDTDDNSSDSDKSDRSIEQAVQSKAQHFTSLKDLHQGHHHSNDPCNCPLRRDNSPRSFSRTSMNNSAKFKSETSLFFRLSPRRRIENFKHILKSLSSKRRRFRTSTSLHSLSGRSCAYIGVESYVKSEVKSSGGALPSFGQVEHDRASSPVFQFCRPPRQDNLRSLRHSADISYLLKIPNSKSSNASLSSVLEDSTLLPKRAQPPNSLSLGHQDLRIHHKMASVESIGACSLDFDASGADFGKDLTASECTLHSNGDLEVDLAEQSESLDKLKLNGFKPNDQQECTVAEIKLPSYVSISCAINGYPNFSRFCRSRENSPARTSFRKSSLEPSMLAHGSRKEAYEAHRYSRSQSDCNGSVFTESKRVTVSKQITIPLQSFKKYTTEVTFSSNGTTTTLEEEKTVITNGHETTTRVLAKEVGTDGTKSLVQQRIESLYGKSVSEEVHIRKGKEAHVNGDDSITDRSPTPNGKNHIGSVSPPVFRHLNKDFRKQLQINIPKKPDADKTKSKLLSNVSKELLSKKENGFPLISNGHDECDRIKSLTPPPLKSKSIIEEKAPDTPTKDDSEGYRFLNLIDVEKEKIQGHVRSLEEELAVNSASIPEEALGKIRAACGKANLLITQKFEQFRGLCWKHIEENPSVPFYTTATDLAGFWDLVMLQVDDINATFKEINAMQQNGWKEVVCEKPTTQVTKIRHSNPNGSSKSNPSTPKKSAKSAELSKAREEARRQLLAAKKKGRQQAAAKEDEDIAIFAPPSSS